MWPLLPRTAASRPPVCPLFPLWRSRWLCGHPHPAARRGGPARAARDLRVLPGRCLGLPASTGLRRAGATGCGEVCAGPARRSPTSGWCRALDSVARDSASGGRPWLRRKRIWPQPPAAGAQDLGRSPWDLLQGEHSDGNPAPSPAYSAGSSGASDPLFGVGDEMLRGAGR